MEKKFVDTENPKARPDGKYAGVINQIAKDGVCPFCEEHLAKYHKNPLDIRNFWIVTENMYPYKPSKHHFLLILRRHVTHFEETTAEERLELFKIFDELVAKLGITGGSFIMRFGDTKFTGASVTHQHCHIVQSDPDDPSYDPAKGLVMRIG